MDVLHFTALRHRLTSSTAQLTWSAFFIFIVIISHRYCHCPSPVQAEHLSIPFYVIGFLLSKINFLSLSSKYAVEACDINNCCWHIVHFSSHVQASPVMLLFLCCWLSHYFPAMCVLSILTRWSYFLSQSPISTAGKYSQLGSKVGGGPGGGVYCSLPEGQGINSQIKETNSWNSMLGREVVFFLIIKGQYHKKLLLPLSDYVPSASKHLLLRCWNHVALLFLKIK